MDVKAIQSVMRELIGNDMDHSAQILALGEMIDAIAQQLGLKFDGQDAQTFFERKRKLQLEKFLRASEDANPAVAAELQKRLDEIDKEAEGGA
jgi:hypothetical protein